MTEMKSAIDTEKRKLPFNVRTRVDRKLQPSRMDLLLRQRRRFLLLLSKRKKALARETMRMLNAAIPAERSRSDLRAAQ